MQGKERTFTPEVEKVWNKDYQCEYYRGVIINQSNEYGIHTFDGCRSGRANQE